MLDIIYGRPLFTIKKQKVLFNEPFPYFFSGPFHLLESSIQLDQWATSRWWGTASKARQVFQKWSILLYCVENAKFPHMRCLWQFVKQAIKEFCRHVEDVVWSSSLICQYFPFEHFPHTVFFQVNSSHYYTRAKFHFKGARQIQFYQRNRNRWSWLNRANMFCKNSTLVKEKHRVYATLRTAGW